MIKMKHFLANITQMTARVWKSGLLCLALCAMPLTGCDEWENWFDDEDEDGLISVSEALKNGMIKLTENIGEWETAVIYAEDGYILYKNDTINESQSMDYFQIQSPNADYDCAIYADKFTSIPKILILGDETYHFHNEGDSIIHVTLTTEEDSETLYSIRYTMSDETQSRSTFTTITYLNRDDKVQRVVKALDVILNAGTNYTSSQIKKINQALDNISMFYYYEDVESIIDSLDLCREIYGETGDSVIYCFTQYATKVKVATYDPVKYSIYVQTGWPKSVQGTSAIVRGKVICMSNAYRDLGRWGIIYSTNRSNLSLDNCEGIVYTDIADFEVILAGLKENTTYYYKAFYKFDSSDHKDLRFQHGDRDAEYYVDSWYHSFTTNDEDFLEDEINPIYAIDLGLSVKWACCNIGASAPEGYGGYYAWGETKEKSSYNEDNYIWNNPYSSTNKYSDSGNRTVLDPEDDVAHVKWGGAWRMPTHSEIEELINNCTWEIATYNGVNGQLVTGPNGNSIFLPVAGQRIEKEIHSRDLNGYYWISTPDEYRSFHTPHLSFLAGDNRGGYKGGSINSYYRDRHYGRSVRPVKK